MLVFNMLLLNSIRSQCSWLYFNSNFLWMMKISGPGCELSEMIEGVECRIQNGNDLGLQDLRYVF